MKKIYCFNCGKQIKYEENGVNFAFGLTYTEPATGKEFVEPTCVRCTAQFNKESKGELLGVDSIADIDLTDLVDDEKES